MPEYQDQVVSQVASNLMLFVHSVNLVHTDQNLIHMARRYSQPQLQVAVTSAPASGTLPSGAKDQIL